ncbi:MAG: hypothetical protein ACREA2_01300 [Blastocatellia bacterium]
MKQRAYYSMRTGKNLSALKFDLQTLRRLFSSLYQRHSEEGYFQEAFGYFCVDGRVSGTLGNDIEAHLLLALRKSDIWPIEEKIVNYSEHDLFDIIELLYDLVSKPIKSESSYHAWNGCGWHHTSFDQQMGCQEFRGEVNNLLQDYQEGYELSESGEILILAEPGLDGLLQAPLPEYDSGNVNARIEAAILKFRRYRSSTEDRRDAIRGLADVFEFLRPKLKACLTQKDESDLFNIANNFDIRHHNSEQKTNYDKDIWHSWMFYFYLSTIHASLRLIKRSEEKQPTATTN